MAGSAVAWDAAQDSAQGQSWNRGWWLLWPSQRAPVDMMEGRALISGSVDVTQPGGIAWLLGKLRSTLSRERPLAIGADGLHDDAGGGVKADSDDVLTQRQTIRSLFRGH